VFPSWKIESTVDQYSQSANESIRTGGVCSTSMSVVVAKYCNSARPRQAMVHQELPRGFGTSMLESTFAIDMSGHVASGLTDSG